MVELEDVVHDVFSDVPVQQKVSEQTLLLLPFVGSFCKDDVARDVNRPKEIVHLLDRVLEMRHVIVPARARLTEGELRGPAGVV